MNKIWLKCPEQNDYRLYYKSGISFQFQMENNQLVERLIKYKAKDADKMNEENDNFLK